MVAAQGIYRFTDEVLEIYPSIKEANGIGTGNKIVSRIVELCPEIFLEVPADDTVYVKMLVRFHNQRGYRYIKRSYLQSNAYIDKFNVAFPEATGKGTFGETLGTTEIVFPNEGTTDTFLSIGQLDTKEEAEAVVKYIKTKFLRTLLGNKKATQHTPHAVWEDVPLQDFTPASDIDWTQSVAEIDAQLYRKYGLSDEEITFIETNVKEMI